MSVLIWLYLVVLCFYVVIYICYRLYFLIVLGLFVCLEKDVVIFGYEILIGVSIRNLLLFYILYIFVLKNGKYVGYREKLYK